MGVQRSSRLPLWEAMLAAAVAVGFILILAAVTSGVADLIGIALVVIALLLALRKLAYRDRG